mgnify:CR=1 FL=1
MSYIETKSDASVTRRQGVAAGYYVSRVSDKRDNVEILEKGYEVPTHLDWLETRDSVEQVEFFALLVALESAREYVEDEERIVLKTDSRHVVQYLNDGKSICGRLDARWDRLSDGLEVEVKKTPRELNHVADSLAKRGRNESSELD